MPTVCAEAPVYEPLNVRVAFVAVNAPSVPPKETPLICELASIAFVIAPFDIEKALLPAEKAHVTPVEHVSVVVAM